MTDVPASMSVHDEDAPTNLSTNPSLESLVALRLSRRQALLGGLSAATTAVFGSFGLTGCDGDDATNNASTVNPQLKLGYTAVGKNLLDQVTVPAGYTVTVLWSTGQEFSSSVTPYAGAGGETGDSYNFRSGDHHDGMYFFGLNAAGAADRTANDRGILCINHENVAGTQIFLHAAGPTQDASGNRTMRDEVVKEMNAHGVSVIEIRKGTDGKFALVKDSSFNRRITSLTDMDLSGPARGAAAMNTLYSPTGVKTRGTINNCANGFTPWGTYLTCEENWRNYFRRDTNDNNNRTAKEVTALNRYGITQGSTGNFNWTRTTAADASDTRFSRWNLTKASATAAATGDFQNAANTYGWIVEIDPYNPTATPKKRTAMGRFFHEGCWPARRTEGKPVVFYMGCDSQFEYIYKYVSTANFSASDTGLAAGDKYLDAGTLYVAVFAGDGTGSWKALSFGSNGITAANTTYAFTDQVDVLINARLAADAAGATKMDRPEWGAVNPLNGEVYFTLTNNTARAQGTSAGVDAPNPRNYTDQKGTTTQRGNVNGHIIRFREAGNDPTATAFTWDIFAFGAEAGADPATVNLSNLTADNDLSSPDGLWFGRESNDSKGLLWIQTDDGAYTDVTNCMLLAAIPGTVGDGNAKIVGTQTTFIGKTQTADTLRRFLVGPKGCELTGLDTTPDGKALFANIQHPGENTAATDIGTPANYESHWPAGGNARPRSSTIVITRNDGGIVGL